MDRIRVDTDTIEYLADLAIQAGSSLDTCMTTLQSMKIRMSTEPEEMNAYEQWKTVVGNCAKTLKKVEELEQQTEGLKWILKKAADEYPDMEYRNKEKILAIIKETVGS